MNQIEKMLKRLTEKERKLIKKIITEVSQGNFTGLDIKKLKGYENIFRIRKKDIRIIFRKVSTDIFVLSVERRAEKTYKRRTFK